MAGQIGRLASGRLSEDERLAVLSWIRVSCFAATAFIPIAAC